MNIFLLGNGFDLQHGFPTKYINFLNVVDFLCKYYDESMYSVADIFMDERLQQKDDDIKRSYENLSWAYKDAFFDKREIPRLISKAKNNMWFKYLFESYNKDIGWIDFEKEISTVIDVFEEFFSKESIVFTSVWTKDDKAKYILFKFDEFFERKELKGVITAGGRYVVKESYIIETPINSNIKKTNKDKIIDKLFEELKDFADILKLYFICFIDVAVINISKMGLKAKCTQYSGADKIITFNYTRTFEHLYNTQSVMHIHGITTGDIVLGVNPDENDEIENMNTDFIRFKKYFQRVFYRTDESFLKMYNDVSLAPKYGGYVLHISGHSLDVTDSDIIKKMISKAKKVVIYYYDISAVGDYIKNLVAIYGKEKFDEIREYKKLEFKQNDSVEWG